jgi:sugar-phosphatase
MPDILTTRAVLLDMDGTLVDSNAVVERIWLDWAREHGVDAALTLSVIHGRQGHASMAILLPERDAAVNLAENAALLEKERADTAGVVAVAGASDLLAALEGTPHALVTSADEPLAAIRMGAAGLRMPEVRVTAEQVSRSKPDPEGFVRAAELLGFDPADCVVFEDSTTGIAAGLASGATVIGVGPAAPGTGAHYVVADLTTVAVSLDGDGIRITIG